MILKNMKNKNGGLNYDRLYSGQGVSEHYVCEFDQSMISPVHLTICKNVDCSYYIQMQLKA